MPTVNAVEGDPAPFWTTFLDWEARQMARDAMASWPDLDRIVIADALITIAREATRPESEVPTHEITTLEDGRIVEGISHPGLLRRAFMGQVGDPPDPATAALILDVVRAAVAAELHLDPERLGSDRRPDDVV